MALSISSTTGAREIFTALGALVEVVGEALGKVIDEPEALALIAREDEDAAAAARRRSSMAGMVSVVLAGAGGETLREESTYVGLYRQQQLPGGMLRPVAVGTAIPTLLSDGGRFPLRGQKLEHTRQRPR